MDERLVSFPKSRLVNIYKGQKKRRKREADKTSAPWSSQYLFLWDTSSLLSSKTLSRPILGSVLTLLMTEQMTEVFTFTACPIQLHTAHGSFPNLDTSNTF